MLAAQLSATQGALHVGERPRQGVGVGGSLHEAVLEPRRAFARLAAQEAERDFVQRIHAVRPVEHGTEQHLVAEEIIVLTTLRNQVSRLRTGQQVTSRFAVLVAREPTAVGQRSDIAEFVAEQFGLVAVDHARAVVGQAGSGAIGHELRVQRQSRILNLAVHCGIAKRQRLIGQIDRSGGEIARAVVVAEPVGGTAFVTEVVAIEVGVVVEAKAQTCLQRFGFGKFLGLDVDQTTREVARQIGREVFVDHDVFQQRRREEVHLHGVPFRVQSGDVRAVERGFRVAIRQPAHVDVLAALDTQTGHALERIGGVAVAAQRKCLTRYGVDRVQRFALEGLHGVFGVGHLLRHDGEDFAILAHQFDGGCAEANIREGDHFISGNNHFLAELVEAGVRHHDGLRSNGQLQFKQSVEVGLSANALIGRQKDVAEENGFARFAIEDFTAYGTGLGKKGCSNQKQEQGVQKFHLR